MKDYEARFWAMVAKVGQCWEWQGCRDPKGYGRFSVGGRKRQYRRAHRVAYELTYGVIPQGLVLDHFVCSNPSCVRPDHLVATTSRANTLRGQGPAALCARRVSCPNGHPYSTILRNGNRRCQPCANASNRASRALRKLARVDLQKGAFAATPMTLPGAGS